VTGCKYRAENDGVECRAFRRGMSPNSPQIFVAGAARNATKAGFIARTFLLQV
jgi:hypothetical protein